MNFPVSIMGREALIRAFRLSGIFSGDTVLMHSALSSVGHVEGGADGIIDALLSLLGDDGTLAVVAMSGVHPFDAETSPSVVGIISEALRRRPGAVRSLRPVHSVAAIGKNAHALCDGHDKCETNCGEGSPYTRLCDLHGKLLLLGVDMNRNTALHAVEDLADSRYLKDRVVPMPTYMPDYLGKTMTIKKFPPGHRDFLRLTPALRRAGAITNGVVGHAEALVIDAEMMFAVAKRELERDEFFMLCENPACAFCSTERRA